MNIQETLSLIEALKSAGVTKFKSLEHDISFESPAKMTPISAAKKEPAKNELKESEPEIKENVEATEKLKELIGTLKMSDEDLVNKLFPDGAL